MIPARVFLVKDSFEFLRGVTSGDVACVITDPPFPSKVQENLCSGSLVGTKSVPKYDLKFPPLSRPQLISGFGEMLRIARRWVISFCAVESFGHLQDAFPEEYIRGAIWAKSNAMGQLTGDRPATSYEGVACLHRAGTKKGWNGRGSYGIWSANGTRGKKDRHPNEKPLDLALKLVALFSDRGETVLDPFCGSAAIGEACVRLGRGYIGLDWDASWVERSRERLARAQEAVVAVGGMSDEAALPLCPMWGAGAKGAVAHAREALEALKEDIQADGGATARDETVIRCLRAIMQEKTK